MAFMSEAVIRPIDADSEAEIELVAQRMRNTLVEVLGAEQGTALYSMEWLIRRVCWHLDSEKSTAAVFLAEDSVGKIVGHTIVRKDVDGSGEAVGLFSTTYVEPDCRRFGVATELVKTGEAWIRDLGLASAETYTDRDKQKLIRLFGRQGYELSPTENQMVILRKNFSASTRP